MATTGTADLVIVANRLPVDRVTDADGSRSWRASPGGLVTAIEPVMRANDGVWIGWPGGTEQGLEPFEFDGLSLVPMSMRAEEIENFYEGFSNATLWPLYHDVVAKPEFHREWWDAYVAVNRRFAEQAAELAAEGATVWVHDYQLQLVPQMLRELRPDLQIGFYLHIPFPPAELFQQLPWRRQILEGLLGADLVGFQLPGGAPELRAAGPPAGRAQDPPRPRLPARRAHRARRRLPDLDRLRRLRGAGPLGGGRGARRARSARRWATRARCSSASTGSTTPRASAPGSRAFGELIEDGHLDVEDAVFVQVATPSRERVEQYRILRDDIDRLVGHDQRRPRARSAGRRSPTCTPPTPARRWPRSTAPRTSWW